MVPGAPQSTDRPPSGPPIQVGSPEAAQVRSVPQSSGESSFARVASVERSLRAKGFSREVSSRIARPNRSSSLGVYESKWRVFSDWCSRRQVDPLHSNAQSVADFLLEKYQSGSAPSTLAGYRTAIAKTVLPYTGVNLGDDQDLSALLNNFKVERPVARNEVPQWDLSLVLNRLASAPFEPLSTAPLKFLTWKTVFLLALASGRCRGELHALDFSSVRWKEDNSKVTLRVIPSFLAKTQLATSPPLAVTIPSLRSSLGQGMGEDCLLCPVQALRVCLKRTKGLRMGKKLLFISHQKKFSRDIRAATISSWIKKCIRTCYDLADQESPCSFKVRAHDVRALAASLAYMGRVPLDQVMQACSWQSHNTFTSFYLRDLTWKGSEGYHLGPVVASQCVVRT